MAVTYYKIACIECEYEPDEDSSVFPCRHDASNSLHA